MTRFLRRGWSIMALVLALALTACSGADEPAGPAGPPEDEEPGGKITVFAAASLTEAFQEIAAAFEAEYAGVEVEFNFAGTPTLRSQLELGARADVFASANLEQMEIARRNGVVEEDAVIFARNALVIITPEDNPGDIESPADLARDGLKLVLAHEAVPAGAYTRDVLEAMSSEDGFGAEFRKDVLDNAVSLESNVKQVVAKVELGEADAGIVYATDVTPAVAPGLTTVAIPEAFNVIARYPAALVTDRGNDVAARAFLNFLVSRQSQAVLAKYGFLSAG